MLDRDQKRPNILETRMRCMGFFLDPGVIRRRSPLFYPPQKEPSGFETSPDSPTDVELPSTDGTSQKKT